MSEDIKQAVGEVAAAVEALRANYETVQAEIAKRGSADVILTEADKRIEAAVAELRKRQDEIELRAKRDQATAEIRDGDGVKPELRAAVNAYLRRGETSELLVRSAVAGVDSDGGYLTTTTVDQAVARLVKEISPVRQFAQVISISTPTYSKPVDRLGVDSGWVGEEAARAETNTPALSKIEPPMGILYAKPKASETLLEDAFVNVEAWLAESVAEEFAQKEGAAFIAGNGADKPRGFLTYTKVAESGTTVAGWGETGYVASGQAGAFGDQSDLSPHPADVFVDCVSRLKAAYRPNAVWLMNRFTEAQIAKIKDADGNYIWRQGLVAGNPSTLLGYAIGIAEDMPVVADGAFPVAFGDFRRAYLIVDRLGIATLRDPYSAKPYVEFYTRKRVGGAVQMFEAIKLIKTATA